MFIGASTYQKEKIMFEIGKEVMTPHGKGVIADYEMVNCRSYQNPNPLYVPSGRYGVKLDDGHTWAIKNKIAYYQPHEISEYVV